jgi:hypothetical protein
MDQPPPTDTGGSNGDNGGGGGGGGGSGTSSGTPTPTPTPGGGSAGSGGGGSGGGTVQCYSETVTTASLEAVKKAFVPDWGGNWLDTSLAALMVRTPGGYAVLEAEKDDSQLPNFADPSSWDALMQALMTMCHEETHGYDYGHADANSFNYFMPPTKQVRPPATQTFPRSEILDEITDDSTQQYDQTYLMGDQGSYGFIEMNDELNAYTNGLACIAAVGDQITSGISARDGVAASLYYLELYLRKARIAHADVYAALKSSPDWQSFVRFAWARGHFWYAYALPNANLGIADARIWAHVHEALNRDEIAKFTGEDSVAVACSP